MGYKIVPNGTQCFAELDVNTPEEAMAVFAAEMDTDMNQYFRAVKAEEEGNSFERLCKKVMDGEIPVSDIGKVESLKRIYDGLHPELRERNHMAFLKILSEIIAE